MSTSEQYVVVVNHEEQFSIWAAGKQLPEGWKPVGEPKNREDCLSYIEENWIDMRPKSLRS